MPIQLKLFICFLTGVLFFTVTPALAAPNINELTGKVAEKAGYDASDTSNTALSERVGGIIRVALTMIGTLFIALTVYSGFLWMTASGNEERVKQATNILKMAVIGLVITMASYGISRFVVAMSISSAGQSITVGADKPKQHPWYTKEFWQDYGQGFVDTWNDFKQSW